MLTIEEVKFFEASKYHREAVKKIGHLTTHQPTIRDFTFVRDFIILQLLLNNAQRVGALKNMLFGEYLDRSTHTTSTGEKYSCISVSVSVSRGTLVLRQYNPHPLRLETNRIRSGWRPTSVPYKWVGVKDLKRERFASDQKSFLEEKFDKELDTSEIQKKCCRR
jgi:hypothetical protein